MKTTSSTGISKPRTSSTPAAPVSKWATLASARWAATARHSTRSVVPRLTLHLSSSGTSITWASLWTSGPWGWCCSSWWREPCRFGPTPSQNWSAASWRGPTCCLRGCQRRVRGLSGKSSSPRRPTAAPWSRWWAASGCSPWTSRVPWSPSNLIRATWLRVSLPNCWRRTWRSSLRWRRWESRQNISSTTRVKTAGAPSQGCTESCCTACTKDAPLRTHRQLQKQPAQPVKRNG